MRVTKTELIQQIATDTGITQADIARVVNLVLSSWTTGLEHGKRISIKEFGSFRVKQCRARQIFNPVKKAKIDVPAKRVVTFKASRVLLAMMNRKEKTHE